LTAHIEHIRSITGPEHIGIGADYDGVSSTPEGLEDVSKYPDLFEAIIRTGNWSADDLEKLSGRNLLRVFRDVEKVVRNFSFVVRSRVFETLKTPNFPQVRDELQKTLPVQEMLTRKDYAGFEGSLNCTTAELPGDTGASRRKRGISDDFEEL